MSFAIRIIQPSNFLSVSAINFFQIDVNAAVESEAPIVLVDLSNVTSMSSANFIAVVKILQLVRASNRQLFLCSMSEQIRMLFELTGLDQVFKTFVNFDEFNRQMHMHGAVGGASRQAKCNPERAQRDSFKLAS